MNTIAFRISVGADDWIAERGNGDGKPNWNEVKEAKNSDMYLDLDRNQTEKTLHSVDVSR